MFDLCELLGLTEEEASDLEYYYDVDDPVEEEVLQRIFMQVLDACCLTALSKETIL